jgi:hypothetical protein
MTPVPPDDKALRKAWLKQKFASFEYHEEMLRTHAQWIALIEKSLARPEVKRDYPELHKMFTGPAKKNFDRAPKPGKSCFHATLTAQQSESEVIEAGIPLGRLSCAWPTAAAACPALPIPSSQACVCAARPSTLARAKATGLLPPRLAAGAGSSQAKLCPTSTATTA